jgi:type II secretory pathway component HofQ
VSSQRLRSVAAVLAALWLLGLAVPAAAASRVYKAQHRTAEELLPLAQAAVGAEGSVVIDPNTNSLVILGSERAIAEALALLAQQDQRLRSVVIQYREESVAELDEAGVDVRWSAGSGPVRIGNVVSPEPGVDVRAASSARGERGHRGGTLRVLEGQTGRIETGTQIPYQAGGWRNPTTQFVNAASGFEVRPRILGDGRVRLELRPFGAQPAADGTIAVQGAETVVVVRPGETVVVGGMRQDVDMRMQGSRGAANRRGTDRQVLLVTVATD